MKKAFLLLNASIILQFAFGHDLPGIKKLKSSLQATSSSTGFASNAITVAGGNGQGFAANQLQFPGGISLDQAGNLYIADGENARVQKWAPGAITGVTVAGGNGGGSAANQLSTTFDVSVDLAGNIYVLDGYNLRIQKWAPGATSGVTVAGGNGQGSAANQLNYPGGFYLDAAGNLYIADGFNNRVQKWAPGASAGITVAGGHGAGSAPNQLSDANTVFVDATGNIYVSDAGNNRIQKWAPGASAGITVVQGKGQSGGLDKFVCADFYVDQAGDIYIADGYGDRILKWAPFAPAGVSVAGGYFPANGPDQLYYPSGITFDAAGNLYVSDGRNQRVQKFLADKSSCPADIVFAVPSCTATTTIKWTTPADTFPLSIDVPEELSLDRGKLNYMGTLNGHGYYKSSLAYPWPVAKDIAFYIGDTSVSGHLITISSAAENNFIYNMIKGTGYSPWIGLSSAGKPGQFAWVDGQSLSYTNWAPNEPNNASGNSRYVKEPYVRLQDNTGTWNDQRSDKAPFTAEFDQPVIRYKQIAGPASGSTQGTGVYAIKYEITNTITDQKDTCSFNVIVSCASSALSNTSANAASAVDVTSLASTNALNITTSPNPTSNYFKLKISGGLQKNAVNVTVTDALGKIVESRKNITPGQTLELGANYRSGIYFVQVIQGSEKAMVKIVKQ